MNAAPAAPEGVAQACVFSTLLTGRLNDRS